MANASFNGLTREEEEKKQAARINIESFTELYH